MMKKLIPLLLCLASPCFAETQDDVLQGAILPGWQTKAGHRMAAVHLTLAPGWKTYWRAPGDAGIPPSFDWSRSRNVKAVHIHWPSPSVFHNNGMQSIGYHDILTLPVEVVPMDPSAPVDLNVEMELGICDEICVPAFLQLTSDLTPDPSGDSAIKAALKAQPRSGAEAGLAGISCDVAAINDGLRITAHLDLPVLGAEETVVFEAGRPDVWVAQSVTTRNGGQLIAVTDMVEASGKPFALDRSGITLTVIAGSTAIEVKGCPSP